MSNLSKIRPSTCKVICIYMCVWLRIHLLLSIAAALMVHNAHICGTCCTDGIVAYPSTYAHISHITCKNYSKLPLKYCSGLCNWVAFFPWLFPLGKTCIFMGIPLCSKLLVFLYSCLYIYLNII